MGLDMYLMKDVSENQNAKELIDENREKTVFWEKEYNSEDTKYSFNEIEEALVVCYDFDYYALMDEVIYWRKANMIHAWFVDNVQGGVDDCGFYPVSIEQLQQLLNLCEIAYISKESSLLMPRSGFFFGSTEIDESYWYDIEKTITQLRSIINLESPESKFLYHSSW